MQLSSSGPPQLSRYKSIFFPLSSQHHNVTTRCRPLAYHDHVLVNESAISPSHSDPISSYKSTFVGVILGHSTLALSNISTPPDALTSCFSGWEGYVDGPVPTSWLHLTS